MDQKAVSELMDKWMNDEAFRAGIRKDPEGTVKAAGVTLDDEQWKAFKAIDWSKSDEELKARVSKSVPYADYGHNTGNDA
jgi:hypothetical protein